MNIEQFPHLNQDETDQTSSTSQTQNKADIPDDDPFLQELQEPAKPSADSVVTPEGDIVAPTPAAQPKEPLSDKDASDNTRMFIDLREVVQGGGIAWYADGNMLLWEKYKYNEDQKRQLIDAWTPLIQKSGIKVNPWIKVLATEAMCTGPLVALAAQNRKYRKENEELRAQLARAQAMQGYNPGAAQPQMSARYNNKNAWKIDELGRFVHGADGSSKSYIKADLRTERPRLPQDYEMLIQHNDKDFVHRVLNLPIAQTENEEPQV